MNRNDLIKVAMQNTGLWFDENDNITSGNVDDLQKLCNLIREQNDSPEIAALNALIDAAAKSTEAVSTMYRKNIERLTPILTEALAVLEYNWENYPEAGSQSDLETIQKLRALLSDDATPAATIPPVTTMAIDVQAGQFVISDSNGKTCVSLGNFCGPDKSITNMVQNDYLKI